MVLKNLFILNNCPTKRMRMKSRYHNVFFCRYKLHEAAILHSAFSFMRYGSFMESISVS